MPILVRKCVVYDAMVYFVKKNWFLVFLRGLIYDPKSPRDLG